MDNKKVKYIINQIEVPKEEVLSAIDRGIRQGNQIKTKRQSLKKIMISGIITASIFGITLSSGFVNPNMNRVLAEVPFLGEIYEAFGDKMGLQLAQQHLVTELHQAITKNGVTVKLTSAYFDGDVVSITGQVTGDLDKGKNEKDEINFDVNFENNQGDHDPWLNRKSVTLKNTENGYDFQWKLSYPYKTIQDGFTLPISIHYINGIKGEWHFKIPVTQKKNKTLTINHVQSYKKEGVEITIHDIKLADASSILEIETVSNHKDDQIDIEKAMDEKGNKLFHYANNTELSQSKEDDGYHSSLRKMINKIDEDVQSITFYPFMKVSEPPVQQLLNASSFILGSQRTDLKIKVNNITKEDDQLILNYQFQGFAGDMSNHRRDMLLNNLSYAFTLIDRDFVHKIDPENPVPPENYGISRNKVKLLDKKTYHFQSVFHLDGEHGMEDFSLQDTVLQFDFSNFIETKKLAPFTILLP